MAELALMPIEQEQDEKKAWERMPGEPLFWFNRYRRFQSLGPKRTVLAALEQERKMIKAPKSTQNGQKPKPKPKKSVAVPGSWKAASIRWHWVARAQSYDEDKVTQIVAVMFEDLYSTPALAFNRVMALNAILDTITKDYNANNARMSPDQRVAYFARMTTILRDIREEMKTFDNPTQALIQRHYALKEYEEYKSPTSAEGYMQLEKRAGGAEALSKQIEQEIARRKELARLKEELGQ